MKNKNIIGLALLLLSSFLMAQQPDSSVAQTISKSTANLNIKNQSTETTIAPNAVTDAEKIQTPNAVTEVEKVQAPNAVTEVEKVQAPNAVTEVEKIQAPNAVTEVEKVQAPNAVTEVEKIQAPNAVTEVEKVQAPNAVTEVEKVQTPTSTILSGDIHGFLTKDKSPYIVTQPVAVPSGRVLIIEPGVKILFKKGTSLSINQGQLIAGGTEDLPIIFTSADSSDVWDGISITGENTSDIRSVEINGAKTAIMLQDGILIIRNSTIQNSSERGLFAIQSNLKIIHSVFKNNTLGVHLATQNESHFEENLFTKNKIGLYLSPMSKTEIYSTTWKENRLAILHTPKSKLSFYNSSIENNEVGISSSDIFQPENIEQVKNNKINFHSDYNSFASKIPIPQGIDLTVKEETTPKQVTLESNEKDSLKWSMIGNISAGANYRYVYTRRNHGVLNEIINQDTIHVKDERYPNIWEIPGFAFNTDIYLMLKSNKNQSLEISTNFISNSWNRADLNVFSLRYLDKYNSLELGDFYLTSGEVFLEGLSVFGANYRLSLLKNDDDHPLFTFGGFFGESQKPLVTDTKNPYLYNDWIDDGEVQAQRLAWGGDLKWDPLRRFNAHLGVLFSDDEIDDPLLRDGDRATVITTDPLQSAMALYAEGNWLFFPGDIELNGQIAIGRSDTTDAVAQRAINQVFEHAGLTTSSFATLRKLMQNSKLIQTLDREEMIEIFGDYSSLTNTEMRDSLTVLIQQAKKKQKELTSDIEESRTMGLDFTSQNVALGASLLWNINKTTLYGHIKYIGENYYSPGSPYMLNDHREFGGYLKQQITSKWALKFNYEFDVANAAKDTASNIFGLSEGTRLGLFEKADSLYLKKHELDNDRTKYHHNLDLENTFKINKNTELFVKYNFDYQKQHRPYRLRGVFDAEVGIFKDSWFKASAESDTTTFIYYGDTTYVDSARWNQYRELTNNPIIASDFEENLYKHSLNLGFYYSFWNTKLKVNGIWTKKLDGSFFNNDSLIEDIHLSNSTWGKLGYYFNGANYFEHKYPISLQTKHIKFTNILTLTPRFKTYERDEMKEKEWSLSNSLTVPLFSKFLTLGLSIEMRTFRLSWEETNYALQDTLTNKRYHYYRIEKDNLIATNKPMPTDNEVTSNLNRFENGYELVSELEEETEKENDLIIEVSAKINHTKQLSSEWICRGEFYDRPDLLSNEYKTFYVGFTFNYSF